MASSIRAALCLWAMQCLSAQITNLATTDDGAVVYFSTTLRPVGTASGYTQKILTLAAGRTPIVFAEREMEETGLTNPFQLDVPSLSGDGFVVAYTGARTCLLFCGTGWGAGMRERFQGDVVSSSGSSLATGDGVVSVSSNGRYAVFHSKGEEGRLPYDYQGVLTRVDLTTGGRVQAIPGFSLNKPYQPVLSTLVGSNGLVVAMSSYPKGLVLFDGVTVRKIPLNREAYRVAMDDQARTLYFETGTGAGSEIASYDVASGWEQSVVSCAEGAWQPSLSRDGGALLFLSPANFSGRNDRQHVQAFLMRVDGSELRQLTRPEDEITSAVLSGDGRLAYAATARNQLLRISVIDGSVEEVIAATSAFAEDSTVSAPGSALEISGSGFADDVRVLLGDQPVPVLWVTATQMAVQVPWETPLGEATLSLAAPAKSSLERGTMTLTAAKDHLRFLRGQCDEDNLSMMTACAPVWLGGTLHVYMTGLGPVAPKVPTGVAAPAEPLAVATGFPKSCRLNGGGFSGDVEVISAALAPEQLGVYRVDIKLPDALQVSDYLTLYCATATSSDIGSFSTRRKP